LWEAVSGWAAIGAYALEDDEAMLAVEAAERFQDHEKAFQSGAMRPHGLKAAATRALVDGEHPGTSDQGNRFTKIGF
jgi:hypothetical protein